MERVLRAPDRLLRYQSYLSFRSNENIMGVLGWISQYPQELNIRTRQFNSIHSGLKMRMDFRNSDYEKHVHSGQLKKALGRHKLPHNLSLISGFSRMNPKPKVIKNVEEAFDMVNNNLDSSEFMKTSTPIEIASRLLVEGYGTFAALETRSEAVSEYFKLAFLEQLILYHNSSVLISDLGGLISESYQKLSPIVTNELKRLAKDLE